METPGNVTVTPRGDLPNPYFSAEEPLFFGREPFFDWLSERLLEAPITPLLFLCGKSKMGKTAILGEMANRLAKKDFEVVYINCRQARVTSFTGWLWLIANVVVADLPDAAEDVRLREEEFLTAPRHAFETMFWEPIANGLNGRSLLIQFDNAEELIDSRPRSELFPYLHQLVLSHGRLNMLFATRISAMDLGMRLPGMVEGAYNLQSLHEAAALDLIRRPVPYGIYGDVADYMLTLTESRPFYLQLVSYLLFERWRKQGFSHVTKTDVAAVIRDPVYQESNPPRAIQTLAFSNREGVPATATLAAESEAVEAGAEAEAEGPPRWLWAGIGVGVVVVLLAGYFLWPRSSAVVEVDDPTPTQTQVALAEVQATPTIVPDEAPEVIAFSTATPLVATPTAVPTLLPTTTRIPPATPTPLPTENPDTTATATAESVISQNALDDQLVVIRVQDDMPMVRIPAGEFIQGEAPEGTNAPADEQPPHRVKLDAFYIDLYEVNVAQYATFLNATGNHRNVCAGLTCTRSTQEVGGTFLVENEGIDPPYFALEGFENYPINHVTWFGASAYCAWVGGRLPTESEWEYAARGTDGRLYPWGDEPPAANLAIFATAFNRLRAVDALEDGVSFFGVYGMAGSMWEWVNDWYAEDYYAFSSSLNPLGPPDGADRVLRGGSWTEESEASRLRAANRNFFRPATIRADIGFRCAYDLDAVEGN